MSKPCIICVAITGSVPKKKDNPNVPISISEQIESTHEAFEAGATICPAHVRNEDETPTSDPEKFSLLKDGISKHCPGMIIQFSTGGRSGSGKERGGMLPLKPDMASLSVGSNNFPTATLEFRSLNRYNNDGGHIFNGNLTIKGITNEVEFSAKLIKQTPLLHAVGKLVFDRSKFNVRFRSGSFFDDLGDKLILDDIEVDINLIAEPA